MFVANFLLLYLQIFLLSHVQYYHIPSYLSILITYTPIEYQSTFLDDNLLTFLGPLFFTITFFPTFLPFYLSTFLLSYFPTYFLTFKLSKLSTSIILFSSFSSQFYIHKYKILDLRIIENFSPLCYNYHITFIELLWSWLNMQPRPAKSRKI